ncbi:MAG: hypothetical protein WDM90_17285 [Ferruginibacter sp.]
MLKITDLAAMKKIHLLILSFFILGCIAAQNKPAYILYNAKGKKVKYKKMMKLLVQQDVVLIGEFHNNPHQPLDGTGNN